jgi:hypothetical protein
LQASRERWRLNRADNTEADLDWRGAFAKREASASNVRMNPGRAKRTRREIEAVQGNITGRTNKLNRLLCAALSNANLRRSLGENAEIIFSCVIKLLLVVLNWSCRAMQRPRTGQAERCERNNDNSAYHSSECPVNVDSVAHIHSIRFNLFGRKLLYPAGCDMLLSGLVSKFAALQEPVLTHPPIARLQRSGYDRVRVRAPWWKKREGF